MHSSQLSQALYEQFTSIGRRTRLPPVRSFNVSPPASDDGRSNNFAYLELDDGSIGLTYTALGHDLEDLNRYLPALSLEGLSPVELFDYYRGSQGWQRAVGLAAINAVSDHLLTRAGIWYEMPDNADMLLPRPGERIGMVGYFGRMVEPLLTRGASLTVIELDEALIRHSPGLEVTLDASRLEECSQVVITGTTLLNDSLEKMLAHCRGAREVHLLGPTASCLPEVLFSAGVTRVGGFHVSSPSLFARRWAEHGRWRDAGRRYLLTPDNYPGTQRLLESD
ncbi:MAG: DUF364 domain-containing protein [Granulosicoccus sp.]|nr:DUF364 domain-containing protein [Granulosicoccus sp.]